MVAGSVGYGSDLSFGLLFIMESVSTVRYRGNSGKCEAC